MYLKYIFIALFIFLSVNSLLANENEELKFTVKSLGVLTCNFERREATAEESKSNVKIISPSENVTGKTFLDTYKLVNAEGKALWQKEQKCPEILKDRQIRIKNVEYLNEKLFIVYLVEDKVFFDEVVLNEKKDWVVNESITLDIPSIYIRPIKKCELFIDEADKKQVKILFDIYKNGEIIFLYENGVAKKVE